MKSVIGNHIPLTQGVTVMYDGEHRVIQAAFSAPDTSADENGILLYDKKSEEPIKKCEFPSENKAGCIRYGMIEDIEAGDISYLFYSGEQIFPDRNAESYYITGKYGKEKRQNDYKGLIVSHEYNWENTEKPNIPYHDSIIYGLHVRGFTKHATSGVKAPGTFHGIIEKLDYIKELGVTAIELQPCYEFNETEVKSGTKKKSIRLNYWGYKEGYYYAPKSAYAFSKDPVKEFKDLVKACHKNGIEVIMQFYFPETVLRTEISKILRFWSGYYRIDGFHLMGNHLPIDDYVKDPFLSEVKLIYHDTCSNHISKPETPFVKTAVYDESFMITARRFLKGDAGVLSDFMYMIRRNPESAARINYIADHSGFTVMDMVTYNEKHNEENGEKGVDGTDYNFSWNCGEEGRTKRISVNTLRNKQIKNAFAMLLLAQGTPFLFMGDEFGNTQEGNNNPYCQDNPISWLNWDDIGKNQELYQFIKRLIAFRKENKVFHLDTECEMKDYKSCGYPDLSFHNESAWVPFVEYNIRNIAFMLCGNYAHDGDDSFWYVAANMHWEPQKFVLPNLPAGLRWEKYFSTETKDISEMEDQINREALKAMQEGQYKGMYLLTAPRSIAVYTAVKS